METLISILPVRLRDYFSSSHHLNHINEIRFRVNKPFIYYVNNEEVVLTKEIGRYLGADVCQKKDIYEVISYISKSSLYAFEEEIKNGFITVEGGHRIGLAGKTVIENGQVKTIKHFTSLNIRVSHAVKGCSRQILPTIINKNKVYNTLILSPPKCGKTTLLRDVVRQISNGFNGFKGLNVGLVDERSEIASCYLSYPQNDVGERTDILDCCHKVDGMLMLIRSMSPDVIVIDELGKATEVQAMEYAINCGCNMICSIHAKDLYELKMKKELSKLLKEGLFKRYIALHINSRNEYIANIYDKNFTPIRGDIKL